MLETADHLSTQDEDPIRKVKKAFQRSDDFMSPEFERLRKMYALYRAEPSTSMFTIATRSQYVVPVVFKTVETVLPRLISVLFSASPPIQSRYRIDPGSPVGYLKLRALDSTFGYLFDEKDLYWVFQAWMKESLIYGQSYLKFGWKQVFSNQTVLNAITNPDGTVGTEKTKVRQLVDDSVDVQNVDIFDLFFSPEAHFPFPFETAKYVIQRFRRRRSQLVEDAKNGKYLPFDETLLKPTATSEDPNEQKANEINRASDPKPDHDDPMITCYEYWEDDYVCTTAEHKVLLKEGENPYGLPGKAKTKPFVACIDTLVYGNLFQIGEAEPLHHNQIEQSTLRRQRTDNNNLIINNMWLYDKDADVDLESLGLSRPGGGVGCRPGQGKSITETVQALHPNDINGASFREFEDLKTDAQDISGLLDYAVGNAPNREETATTVQLLQTAANARFDIKVRNYASCLKNAGYKIFERLKQFQTKPIPLMIPDPNSLGMIPVQVTKESFPEYDEVDLLIPGSPDLLLKDSRQQKLLQYYEALRTNPMVPPEASKEMLTLALKESGIDGIEKILQLLEMPYPPPMMPGMGMPGQQEAGQTLPQGAPQPPGPPQPTQANVFPLMNPMPHPRR